MASFCGTVTSAKGARKGWIVGARSFPGTPYEGDTLGEPLEQAEILMDQTPKLAIVDLGDRGREVEGFQILHRGKSKRLTRRQWASVKRRQAIEPIIGQVQDDCGMRRCRLKGAQGDGLHAIACAAGYNLRWLLRRIALFCAWLSVMLTRSMLSPRPMHPVRLS
jgi:IS5 family transposase